MKRKRLIFIACTLLLSISPKDLFAQLPPSIDFSKNKEQFAGKTQVIYFCATWCLPCMEKLDTIIQVFSKPTDSYNFLVVFDRTGANRLNDIIEKNNYDKTLFKLLAYRYYPHSGIPIQFNVQQRAFKKLSKELKEGYILSKNSLKSISYGEFAVIKTDTISFIDEIGDKAVLIKKVKATL